MHKSVNIVTLWLMNYDGSGLLTGGLERWCRDIAVLVASKGYEVNIYQKATVAFEKQLDSGVKVIGVPCSLSFRGNWKLARWLERHTDVSAPFVFLSQELALSKRITRAVGVNHGIWWDGDYPVLKKWLNKRLQYALLKRLRSVICVDTNYINWCHAELPDRVLWEQKLLYVPNFADLEQFKPVPASPSQNGLLTILFPRRMPSESLERQGRGAGLLLRAVEVLERRGIKTQLLFVGRGELHGAIRDWAASHLMTERIQTFEATLDKMPDVYAQADVVVVPSLAHEGTSFSAIESLLSGKPTVVSHIGGLGNIVIDGLNGHICDLSSESLADAILDAAKKRCLANFSVLAACRESLGKPRWERKVWSILQTHLAI